MDAGLATFGGAPNDAAARMIGLIESLHAVAPRHDYM
jgi:hypothetical protein